ncbi:MAG: DUF378 domain-containing protein [Planctomycetaceae bacterium]|nr:DUF378 domain-containing protein [Planctomycetaceae bacterium]
MLRLNGLTVVTLILMIIGAINWGLVGLFNFNVVSVIFGDMSAISRIIYVIVGLAAIAMLIEFGTSTESRRGTHETPHPV